MFILLYDDTFYKGKTLEDVWKDACAENGQVNLADCSFHELGEELDVEIKIVKKEAITIKGKLPK